MATKLKERIIERISKYGDACWQQIADELAVPRGSATGRLCELAKAGVLERVDGRYKLKQPARTKTKTSYFILLDASTSMSGNNLSFEDRRPGAARLANDAVAEARKHEQDDDFTVGYFAGSTWGWHSYVGVPSNYATMSTGTALCDALIEAIGQASRKGNPSVVLCFTDGEENLSRNWLGLKHAIAKAPEDLTIAILVPKGSQGERDLIAAGIPSGNIRPWTTIEQARIETVASTAEYVEQRKRGVRSTKNYFRADLSHVTVKDFERDLTEVTSQTKRWVAPKETTTEALISERIKADYVPGTGFFEVMKREGKIRGDRKFLLLEPTTGRVFADGRRSVRQVCGYPEGDIAVKPGNHAGFVLLCQSKSSSKDTFRARILPRGTHVVHWPAGR